VNTPRDQHPPVTLSKRSLGAAGAAAVVACAACCLAPLLAAAGLGSSALAGLAWLFPSGSELLVAGAVFAVILGATPFRSYYIRRTRASGCGAACRAGGGGCDCNSAMKRV
jgi:hypothetical protein